jgi:2,3-bisphosphoglycerate-dependent phosphoglycerate mutase
MTTYIYMVRHGQSPKTEGSESTRGLTDKGMADARKVTALLKDEGIGVFLSSPYKRAVLTIEELAAASGKQVEAWEELKETVFMGDDRIYPDDELLPLVKRMYAEPEFAPSGGESLQACRVRAADAVKTILDRYKGQRIAIGTHGLIMTLMMEYLDSQYGLEFLLKTSKPDIYKLAIHDGELLGAERLWI